MLFVSGRGAGGCSVASRGRSSRSWTTSTTSPDHWPRPRARASTPGRTTRPECSASTRPATNCGSTSGHRARPVPTFSSASPHTFMPGARSYSVATNVGYSHSSAMEGRACILRLRASQPARAGVRSMLAVGPLHHHCARAQTCHLKAGCQRPARSKRCALC